MEIECFSASVALSIIGIYLNLCYQRATHRSTVYAKFSGRNLRFLSLAQICLAFSNIVFTAAMWSSRANRSKKSEAFFSVTLSLTRALPAATVFWVTVERVLYNRIASIRDSQKFRYIAMLRTVEVIVSITMEIIICGLFDSSLNRNRPPETIGNFSEPGDVYIKSTLIANYYYDYYHAALFAISLPVTLLLVYLTHASYARSGLLGGMRNEQKIQNLRSQLSFFKHSWLPLYIACFSDFALHIVVKRCIILDDITQDIIYLTARTYLPIIYPLSLIICHENLRADYTTNFFLCRKARNLHKESKVKVIATRESQESIIANLKMIGILSEVDPNQPGAAAAAGMMGISGVVGSGEGGGRANSSRTSIAKDPTSSASMGSLPGGTMLFHTRPKQPVPSVGLVG